jgi:hypothetical protein
MKEKPLAELQELKIGTRYHSMYWPLYNIKFDPIYSTYFVKDGNISGD